MGCGCGKKRKPWVLTRVDGKTSEHASKVEADAANVRSGGAGTVDRKPVPQTR
jgi:hypothetical protein